MYTLWYTLGERGTPYGIPVGGERYTLVYTTRVVGGVHHPGYIASYTTLGTPYLIPGCLTVLVSGAPLLVGCGRGPGL